MSFVVFAGSLPFVRSHPDFIQWEESTNDTVECYSIEEAPQKSSGIFFDPPAIIVIVDSIKASDLRQLLYRAEETGEDICVISEKKPRGKFDKDGINIIDVTYPESLNKRAKVLNDMFSIGKRNAIDIAKKCNDPLQACVVAKQYTIASDAPEWSLFFIPEDKDSPPWLITDAINSGDTKKALKEIKVLLQKKRTTPQSLAMQITGYYTKVLSSENKFFSSIRKKNVIDVKGMVEDMSYFPEVILSSKKTSSQQSIQAYVSSLSSRCAKNKRYSVR